MEMGVSGLFGRYVIVGGVCAVVDVLSFSLLLRAGLPVLSSAVMSFAAATVLNYWLCRRTVFLRGRHIFFPQFIRLVIVSLIGLTLNGAVVSVITDRFDVDPVLAKIIAIAVVLAWNFAGRLLFVFRGNV